MAEDLVGLVVGLRGVVDLSKGTSLAWATPAARAGEVGLESPAAGYTSKARELPSSRPTTGETDVTMVVRIAAEDGRCC